MSNTDKKLQSNLDLILFSLILDRALHESLLIQLTGALRDLLQGSRNYSGARLPASRVLAQELSVSRTTIVGAYDQLISEGYLKTKVGGGTFVADQLPHLTAPVGNTSAQSEPPQAWLPFHSGVPDQTLFPHRIWSKHIERAWAKPHNDLLRRPDPFGWYPLRQAISEHLSVWRKLECRPEQVLITSGASEAIEIIFRSLLGPDQTAAVEDPGWPTMRDVLGTVGADIQPVRIDNKGLDPKNISGPASVAIVTPSRHYPTGISMPLSRRMALLEWAERRNALIIEDDYDSEFRYQGHPLPSLVGLDKLERSIYLGSFSKLLSPALRLGYLVLPERVLSVANAHMTRFGSRASLIPQPALATFMDSGEFAIHLRRMRRTYAKRQSHLISELSGCTDLLDISPDPSGMHICAPLLPKLSHVTTDKGIVDAAMNEGIHLRALSSHCVLPKAPQGLLLGFASFDESALSEAGQRLRRLLLKLF
ncbi:MAG: PLP-dependent aminotransferase family protein [Sulfitobacter sp.]